MQGLSLPTPSFFTESRLLLMALRVAHVTVLLAAGTLAAGICVAMVVEWMTEERANVALVAKIVVVPVEKLTVEQVKLVGRGMTVAPLKVEQV